MIKIIWDFVTHIATIVVGALIMLGGVKNRDYTQFGVGLIVIYLPQIDRIENKVEELSSGEVGLKNPAHTK